MDEDAVLRLSGRHRATPEPAGITSLAPSEGRWHLGEQQPRTIAFRSDHQITVVSRSGSHLQRDFADPGLTPPEPQRQGLNSSIGTSWDNLGIHHTHPYSRGSRAQFTRNRANRHAREIASPLWSEPVGRQSLRPAASRRRVAAIPPASLPCPEKAVSR